MPMFFVNPVNMYIILFHIIAFKLPSVLTKHNVWKRKSIHICFSLKKGRSDTTPYLELYYICLTLYEM